MKLRRKRHVITRTHEIIQRQHTLRKTCNPSLNRRSQDFDHETKATLLETYCQSMFCTFSPCSNSKALVTTYRQILYSYRQILYSHQECSAFKLTKTWSFGFNFRRTTNHHRMIPSPLFSLGALHVWKARTSWNVCPRKYWNEMYKNQICKE